MQLKEITDTKIANFVDVTTRTLQNWKKPQEVSRVKFYPPTGKHNLYIGAKLTTYLLAYKENEETEELNNNLEDMLLSIEKAEKLVEIIKAECKSKYLDDLTNEIKFLKEKVEDLDKISKLN
ncbi:hypothetical protein LNAT_P0659 [Lebetimonas natsushimae]|uniref:Uncharacterized protein n=1 Tax=Lebetimonas natsushimae TaxID=1936991 RepID=A0A292YDV2_9BACT|nr:hypothetical protein [Lebetimonas natsushimae]GAX87364.1 hypothetical protein LNAT_P0659 [Lebetimonas natsushimae]